MAKVFSFRGVRYSRDRVDKLERVTAPPYDVISEADRERFHCLDPHNIIRLILGRELPGDDDRSNRYLRAQSFLGQWLKEGVLTRESTPLLYVYQQEYGLSSGEWRRQRGIVGLLRLEAPGKGVLPHERTLAGPRGDRLEMVRATRCNFSPLLTLYRSPVVSLSGLLEDASKSPDIGTVSDEGGVVHRLWSISSPEHIHAITGALEPCTVYIADGHHRYEVARIFHAEIALKESGTGETALSNHCMVLLLDMDEEQLTILPAHRLVRRAGAMRGEELRRRLAQYFGIEELPFDPDATVKGNALFRRLKAGAGCHTFGLYEGGRTCWVLTLKQGCGSVLPAAGGGTMRPLDVSIMHQLVLEGMFDENSPMDDADIKYETDETKVWMSVVDGENDLAFFLNPTPIEAVRNVADAGIRMPGKATYFYPKPLSGLVMNLVCPGTAVTLP